MILSSDIFVAALRGLGTGEREKIGYGVYLSLVDRGGSVAERPEPPPPDVNKNQIRALEPCMQRVGRFRAFRPRPMAVGPQPINRNQR